MITRLCETVQGMTGRPVALSAISRGVFRYSVRIAEAFPFLSRLSPNDLELFKRRATFSIDNPELDERSIVIPLERPLEIEGRIILALRLKGVYPRADERGIVKPYTTGLGYCKRVCKVNEKDTITAALPSDFDAQGTMSMPKLTTEAETALLLGPERTDLLLGFGIYEDLNFNGGPVGFAVYGMETASDVRVTPLLNAVVRVKGRLPDYRDLAKHTGELLRGLHELKRAHRYPALHNYRFHAPGRAKILDLDTAFSLLSVPAEFRAAFLYLDLTRTINDYMIEEKYEEIYDGEAETTWIPFTPLLPFFLWGYFRGDTALDLVRNLERFVNGEFPPRTSEITRTFGMLPEFSVGHRRFGDNFTLVEPLIRALTGEAGTPIDLKHQDFMVRPRYASFYRAVESVALSL